jgi:hypothetical protein
MGGKPDVQLMRADRSAGVVYGEPAQAGNEHLRAKWQRPFARSFGHGYARQIRIAAGGGLVAGVAHGAVRAIGGDV